MTWYEALATTLIGALGGGIGVWCAMYDRIERNLRKEFEEKRTNAARRKLLESGRPHPRRADAAEGASRISRIRMGRDVKPSPQRKPGR